MSVLKYTISNRVKADICETVVGEGVSYEVTAQIFNLEVSDIENIIFEVMKTDVRSDKKEEE